MQIEIFFANVNRYLYVCSYLVRVQRKRASTTDYTYMHVCAYTAIFSIILINIPTFFIDSKNFRHELTLFIIAVTSTVLGNGIFCPL